MEYLTITPISKNKKSNSHIDYNEQVKRVEETSQIWCWDDTRFNTSQVYGYFAFYFHGKKVIIHQIMTTKDPKDRLPSWSKNVGQGSRNVLELGPALMEISWEEWLAMSGPQNRMQTYRTLLSKYPLLHDLLVNCSR